MGKLEAGMGDFLSSLKETVPRRAKDLLLPFVYFEKGRKFRANAH